MEYFPVHLKILPQFKLYWRWVPLFLIYQLTALNIALFQSLFCQARASLMSRVLRCWFALVTQSLLFEARDKGHEIWINKGLKSSSADRDLTLNYKMNLLIEKSDRLSIESLFLNLHGSFFGILSRRPPKLKRPPSAFFAGYFPVFVPPLTYVKTSDPRD